MKKKVLIYFDDTDKAFWEKILNAYGSYRKCAIYLGITPMRLNDYKSGVRPMNEELYNKMISEIKE